MDTHAGIIGSDERIWRDAVRRFAGERLAPGATQRALDESFDIGVCAEMGTMGYFGLSVSQERGGGGANLVNLCLAYEAIAQADFSAALTLQVQGQTAALLERLDAGRSVEGLIERMATGEIFVAVAITEPQGGSDMRDLRTRIVREPDGVLVVRGAKQFVSNGGTPYTKYHLVVGVDQQSRPVAVLVPTNLPGVKIAPPYRKSGWRSADTRAVFYDDVRLNPPLELRPDEGAYKMIVRFFEVARIPFAAMCLGLAQACIGETLSFVRERRSFGKPLGDHQAISFSIADMITELQTARSIVYRAARMHDDGEDISEIGAIAKLRASEAAQAIAEKACQIHGGYGFMRETAVNRHYLDSRNLSVGEGTSEMMRLIIARKAELAQRSP